MYYFKQRYDRNVTNLKTNYSVGRFYSSILKFNKHDIFNEVGIFIYLVLNLFFSTLQS